MQMCAHGGHRHGTAARRFVFKRKEEMPEGSAKARDFLKSLFEPEN
jgi:hypothetical protein